MNLHSFYKYKKVKNIYPVTGNFDRCIGSHNELITKPESKLCRGRIRNFGKGAYPPPLAYDTCKKPEAGGLGALPPRKIETPSFLPLHHAPTRVSRGL